MTGLAARSVTRTQRALELVRQPGFPRLYLTRISGQLADGVFQAGLAGSILFNPDRRTAPVAIAVGFAVLLLPYSLVGPFAGALLDRWSRRTVLVVANLCRAALVPAVAGLVALGDQTIAFLVVTLCVIAVNRFVLSGLSASLPHVCRTERLVAANSLSVTSGTIAFALGGGLALLLHRPAQELLGSVDGGYGLVAAGAVPLYLAAAATAAGFSRPALGPDAEDGDVPRGTTAETVAAVARGLVAGTRHLAERRAAGYALLALAAHRVLFGVLTLALLLLYRNYLTGTSIFPAGLAGLGQIVLASAAGAFVAAVITPVATRRMAHRHWMTLMLAVCAIVQVALGAQYTTPALVGAAVLLGVAAQGAKLVTDTAVQTECDDDHRGRAFSVYDMAFNVCFVIGLLVGAAALPPDGKSYAVLGAVALAYGVIAAGYAVAAGRWARRSAGPPLVTAG